MSEFTTVTLEGVCTKVTDGTHDSPKLQEFGVPFIKAKHITKGLVDFDNCDYITQEEHEKVIARSKPEYDDILFTNIGASVGRTAIIKSKIEFSIKNVALFKPDPKVINPDYLYFKITSSDFQTGIKNLKSGSAQPFVTLGSLRSFKFQILKSLDDQKAISNTLLNYDNLIENNNSRIAILEDIAQSLYREWFVKFCYPGHADALIESKGNPKLIDSPLGKIPNGWEVKRLDDYVVLQRGFDLPKRNRNEEGGIPIYAASGITGYHDQVKAKGPGLVTGRSGTLGIVKLVLEGHWPLNTSLWVKEFKNCTAHYAYYLLDGIGLERFNSGASVPTLNRNDVHGNPVIAPPTCLIEKFESIASANHKQIHLLKCKNENLKQQRDMLLPKLISGQIKLKD